MVNPDGIQSEQDIEQSGMQSDRVMVYKADQKKLVDLDPQSNREMIYKVGQKKLVD